MKKTRAKPRIRKMGHRWVCHSRIGVGGAGSTPEQAYRVWLKHQHHLYAKGEPR